jgi:acetyltransferase
MDEKIKKLKSALSPKSVAVIGATGREGSVGNAVFSNILFGNYKGVVYPVNPNWKSIHGVKAYPSVMDIPDEIDLAVVIVPSKVVPKVMRECGEKGVKGVVVISAGFKEIGKEGEKLELEIKGISDEYSMPLIGPNCVGIINTDADISLNATFARAMPRRGNIAFVSQSGALGVAALEYARTENIGLSKFISVGNKADINENDLLYILKDDPSTRVILLYLEDLSDHQKFIDLARLITGEIPYKKPIIAIKSGRTMEGARAALSHTGALAGSDEAYDSIFTQCGILRVETLEELFNLAVAFSTQPIPKSNRIAILTNAGGPGILATDAAVRLGLKLADFSDSTKKKLREKLPPVVTINNPLDLIGDADEKRFEVALECILEDKNVDGVVVIATPQLMTDMKAIAEAIVKTRKKIEKPLVATLMATTTDISDALSILDEGKIPRYTFPETAARALASMCKYAWWVMRPRTGIKIFKDVKKSEVLKIIENAKSEGRKFLLEPESHAILQAYGFPVLRFKFVKDEKECIDAAQSIGYPVVLKVVSPDIIHKIDVGGVIVNIKNPEELKEAYKTVKRSVESYNPNARIIGFLVQEMAKRGKETILGMKRDPKLGPLLMFGLGGIYVEIMKDVSFRIAPIREFSAYRMIKEIRGYKILEGVRGEPPSDIDAIAECLERLSQLAMDFEELEELDINPLFVYERGANVVDARAFIKI